MQVSLHRGFWGFLVKSFLISTVQRWQVKKKKARKETLSPKEKRKDFFYFSQGFAFGEENRQLFTPGTKNFPCSRHRLVYSGFLVRDWSDNCGLSVCQSTVVHERDRENGLFFQALREDALSVSQPSDRWRWASSHLCFSLSKYSAMNSRSLRLEERWHCLFSGFENNFCQSKWWKKKWNEVNASLCLIVGSKKEKKGIVSNSGVHAHMSKINTKNYWK